MLLYAWALCLGEIISVVVFIALVVLVFRILRKNTAKTK